MLDLDHHIKVHGLISRVGNKPVEVELRVAELRDPERLAALEPVRSWQAHKHQLGRARMQPVASLGLSAPCESRLEALRLIELDRVGSLQWLVMQPFWISLVRGSKRILRHAPDVVYATRDGQVVVENIRPPERRNEAFERKSELCRSLCSLTDLQYAVTGTYTATEATMLWYLWQYSVVTPLEAVSTAVQQAFSEQTAWRLVELRERCGGVVAQASLLALVWRQVLTVVMQAPLSATTLVHRGPRWSW